MTAVLPHGREGLDYAPCLLQGIAHASLIAYLRTIIVLSKFTYAEKLYKMAYAARPAARLIAPDSYHPTGPDSQSRGRTTCSAET